MEPPHEIFERSHRVLDEKGKEISLAPSTSSVYSFPDDAYDDNDDEVSALERDRRSGRTATAAAAATLKDPASLSQASLVGGVSTTSSSRKRIVWEEEDQKRQQQKQQQQQRDGNGRGKQSIRSSDHSLYTLHSVLIAEGVLAAQELDNNEQCELLKQLPERYRKGSVKAKITWFGAICLAGVGMFVEALVIITTGQIKTIWKAQYPECWSPDQDQTCPENIQCCDLFPNTPVGGNGTCDATFRPEGFCDVDGAYPDQVLCDKRVTNSVSYSEFAGIMAGMLAFGFLVDHIGRKKAGTLTSLLMIVGICGMILFDVNNMQVLFITFSSFFACFGVGVGGEYPLTASGAAEYHSKNAEDALRDDEDQHHRRVMLEVVKTVRRGETISMVFAMQGIGAVVGSLLLLVLIYVSNQSRKDCNKPSSNSSGNNPDALNGIWRGFYLIGMIFVTLLLLYRWLVLEEDERSDTIKERRKRREAKLGENASAARWKLIRFYAPRLIGTGGNWFVWDIAFYGLKLFSGPIFDTINPDGDLVAQNGWLLFNNLCALAGYYSTAIVIDRPMIGRRRLQMVSFSLSAVLFILTGVIFDHTKPQILMLLFFLSSYVGNFGCNVT
jgi:MFS family permease